MARGPGEICTLPLQAISPAYPLFFSARAGPEPDPHAAEPEFNVTGTAARHPYRHPNDDFVQPQALYKKVMSDVDRDHLIDNIVDHLREAKKKIQLRQTALFYNVHPDYGTRVANGLGLNVEDVKRRSK